MDKSELRRELRDRRTAFVEDEGTVAELFVMTLQVAEHAAPVLAGAHVVAAYLSDGVEVDPLPLLFRALDAGCEVALPRVNDRDAPLSFHTWAPGDELVPGPFGLVQPRADAAVAEPDLILTPLVGFDRALNRLGQGAGFYDRTFPTLPNARRIGLAWSVQEVNLIPTDPWDMPLHGIATEREWITR